METDIGPGTIAWSARLIVPGGIIGIVTVLPNPLKASNTLEQLWHELNQLDYWGREKIDQGDGGKRLSG